MTSILNLVQHSAILLGKAPVADVVSHVRVLQDVQAALHASTAPLGSWRVKRRYRQTITVTSVVGLQGGVEFPQTTAASLRNSVFDVWRVGAWLGIDLTLLPVKLWGS